VPKEEVIEMEGVIDEVLSNTQFRVTLADGAGVLAYASGKMRSIASAPWLAMRSPSKCHRTT
jgi:translation initiation factor IF-1